MSVATLLVVTRVLAESPCDGGEASLALTDASVTPVPESLRSAYQDVVTDALITLRPADEDWSVTMMAESEATMRLEFARSTDAPRSFSFASDGDDKERSQLLRLVCQFVWTYWPNEKAVS